MLRAVDHHRTSSTATCAEGTKEHGARNKYACYTKSTEFIVRSSTQLGELGEHHCSVRPASCRSSSISKDINVETLESVSIPHLPDRS